MADVQKHTNGREIMAEAENRLDALAANPYPGRGIIIGKTATGDVAQVYWVMGRSENSRNRLLVREGEGNYTEVKTTAFDESKVEDSSLIIYRAMVQEGRHHIVTNGDQTETVLEGLKDGVSLRDALSTRNYEPDWPNSTPRISGVIYAGSSTQPFELALIKRSDMHLEPGLEPAPEYRHWNGDLRPFVVGTGATIHTYEGDGDPLPSFDQAPYPLPLGEGAVDTADMIWDNLDHDNRVALAVKTINVQTGFIDIETRNQLEAEQAV